MIFASTPFTQAPDIPVPQQEGPPVNNILVGFSTNVEHTARGFLSDDMSEKLVHSLEDHYQEVPAGSSFNVTRAIQVMGGSVKLVCSVGDDIAAAFLDAEFRRLEIDAYPLPIRRATNVSISLLPRNGRRQIHAFKGDYLPERIEHGLGIVRQQVQQVRPRFRIGTGVQLEDAPFVLTMFAEAILRDGEPVACINVLNPGKTLITQHLDELAEVGRATILKDLLRQTHILAVNDEEAHYLLDTLGLSDIRDIQRFGSRGQLMDVIVTHGERGATFYNGGTSNVDIPAYSTEVRDATGAGDCFLGTAIAGIAEGMPREEALQYAAAASGLIVGRIGGSNTPTRAETEALLRENRMRSA